MELVFPTGCSHCSHHTCLVLSEKMYLLRFMFAWGKPGVGLPCKSGYISRLQVCVLYWVLRMSGPVFWIWLAIRVRKLACRDKFLRLDLGYTFQSQTQISPEQTRMLCAFGRTAIFIGFFEGAVFAFLA